MAEPEQDYSSFEFGGRRFSVRWGNLLISQRQAREIGDEEASALIEAWGEATLEGSDTDPSGYVYLAHMPATGHYKIGYSKTPEARVSHFDVQMPVEVNLLHSFPADDARACERWIHEWAKPWRVNGEWFALPEGQALMIQYYRGYKDGKIMFEPDEVWNLIRGIEQLAPGEMQPHPAIKAWMEQQNEGSGT